MGRNETIAVNMKTSPRMLISRSIREKKVPPSAARRTYAAIEWVGGQP